jgi:hypothetical protein
MIITDKFVYVHRPKTGGTFVTNVLYQLHEVKWNLWTHLKLATFDEVAFKSNLGKLTIYKTKHGGSLEIPLKYRNRLILTNFRNPYDYYVSQYEFGWWKRKECLKYYHKVEDFKSKFANFPNLTFIQFMQLLCEAYNDAPNNNFDNEIAIGHYTIDFLRNHFYEPNSSVWKISSDYFSSGDYKNDMFPTHFILTHTLNQQLYDFLLEQGYPKNAIEFILKKEKVLPLGKGRSNEQKWEKYYTPELKKLVRKKDSFLFEMFPEFDEAKPV